MEFTNKYDDIINLPRHVSKKHPQMSLQERSAQFAPFSALVGFEEEIKETVRVTAKRKELDEEQKCILDAKLKIIQQNINKRPKICFKYFIPDLKKNGGEYVDITAKVEKIDKTKKIIILENNIQIPILEIIDISGNIFKQNSLEIY